ncbi:MAG: ATPase [Planctomycetota bacterium]|nr:MAG: ATPase [Planctomycetota bacterium]
MSHETGAFQVGQSLHETLRRLDGQLFGRCRQALCGQAFALGLDGQSLQFVHVQGSTGADPASVLRLTLLPAALNLDARRHLATAVRRRAVFDFLLRAYSAAVRRYCRPNRGEEGSGRFQPPELPQQVLERNVWTLQPDGRLSFLVRISLPGRRPASLIASQAAEMLAEELPAVLASIAAAAGSGSALAEHIAAVEDAEAIAGQLADRGLVAFIPDGARLPRRSGDVDLPADPRQVVPFRSPTSLRVQFELPDGRIISGMGIRQGVTAIIGGGFHGKSTVLAALTRGVYPHIPGDGRERVVTDRSAVLLRAEDGRSVHDVDIAAFIRNLPDGRDTSRFSTSNASGSTSQAAALVEALWAGTRLVLLDEDTSATNFLVRDERMQKLVPDDPITPFVEHARNLFDRHGISTIVVCGSSSRFLDVADCVIQMHKWVPLDRTDDAARLRDTWQADSLPAVPESDPRVLEPDNFRPDFHDAKRGSVVPERIKPLRGAWRVLEYGDDKLDLTALPSLVDPDQVLCIGRLLCLARKQDWATGRSPTALAEILHRKVDATGYADLQTDRYLYLARPRRLDIAAAINRLRRLAIQRRDIPPTS